MHLSEPAPRRLLHTRRIEFQGFLREDGLWDIEASLCDQRAYAFHSRDQAVRPPGHRVHDMLLRVTLDERLVIRAIEAALPATPFPECQRTADPLQRLVGARLGAGWRKTIDAAMGGIAGCTHLRELMFNLATAALQTIPVYRGSQARAAGEPDRRPVHLKRPPPHFGKCMSWDFNGPVMQRVAPEFHGWKPPEPDRPEPAAAP